MFSDKIKTTLKKHFKRPFRRIELNKKAIDVINITRYTNIDNFIKSLHKEKILDSYAIKAMNGKAIFLYASGDINWISPYDLASIMIPRGYFCNLSSIYYHQLTKQVPKSIYYCHETVVPLKKQRSKLTDFQIRTSFIKPSRYTKYIFEWNGYNVILVERVKRPDCGIIKVKNNSPLLPIDTRITCLERALIDSVVAPQYNGGIASVYSYFKAAKNRIKINRLIDIYNELDFVCPYFQTIGLFFDRLGMGKKASRIYDEFKLESKFYVDHDAKSTWKYDDKWKIYYPEGLVDENR